MTDVSKELLPLRECPIGLFWSGNELCLKTEYGNNEGRIDAYIVSTGEFFWGLPPQSIASQREQMVEPIDTDEAITLLTRTPAPSDVVEEQFWHDCTDVADLDSSRHAVKRAIAYTISAMGVSDEVVRLRGVLQTIADESSWKGFSPAPIVERMRELARQALAQSDSGDTQILSTENGR
jgi:hypothetical protein